MNALTGFAVMGNYAGAANDAAAVQILIDMIPNPDSTSTSGAQAGGTAATMLDEMSPTVAAQLRVELAALKDAVDTTNTL